jgi:septal ring factor EnvC (AmiA/AmiB activator)
MINKIINLVFGKKKKKRYMICSDEHTNTHASLLDMIAKLEARVEYLEKENIGTSNYLYELDNRIDSIEQKNKMDTFDKSLRNFSLEK